jgi:putative RNA 2'-phosphotransferase
MRKSDESVSKYLSYILRHKPESIGLKLDKHGWADIDEIIKNTTDFSLTKEMIKNITAKSDKKRFLIEGNKIRANQGHSLDVDLELSPQRPPKILYHGTAQRFVSSILKEGIIPQSRQYVHLSQNVKVATSVGKRHGKPTVLKIDAAAMYEDGITFYLSKNGVWLTRRILPKYIVD